MIYSRKNNKAVDTLLFQNGDGMELLNDNNNNTSSNNSVAAMNKETTSTGNAKKLHSKKSGSAFAGLELALASNSQ